MIAVIAAGGKGTRLSGISGDLPKPMVRIGNKPILEHQINCLKNNNITDIVILIGHLGNKIKEYFGDGKRFNVNIKYIEESAPLGSGGALYYLRDLIKDDFLFVLGDLLFDIDIDRMYEFHKKHSSYITLFTHPNSHPFDSDLIVEKNDLVLDIDSKDNQRNYYYHNLVNAGVYIVSNRIFDDYFLELKKVDFDKDIVKPSVKHKAVYSYMSPEYVKDAGTVERFNQVCEDYTKGFIGKRNLKNKQKCIFIDRDGTINKYKGFIKCADSIELEDSVIDAFKIINNSDYLLVVITNQPVIARGEASLDELQKMHDKIETLLGKGGAYINDILFCPHHPDSGYDGEISELKIKCNCRKPNIGLLLKAQEKYNIDFEKSYFVGDSTVDIMTGKNANIKTILVMTGVKGEDRKYDVKPDFVIQNLSDLWDIIKE